MKNLFLLVALIFCSLTTSYASHIISAEITYTHVTGNDYEVTLSIYRDCSGINLPITNETINIQSANCGQNFQQVLPYIQSIDVSPVCPGQFTTCNGGTVPGVEQFIYRGIVTLTPCSDWIMNWSLCCRNAAITNIVNPGGNSFYTQNTLNNIAGTNNNSPQYLSVPYLHLDVNSLVNYNHGATDADGDSLYYSLVSPLTIPGPPGIPIAFNFGYTQNQPVITSGGINFIQETGAMSFTPSTNQLATVSTLIEEYRNGVFIASQIREMQVIVSSAIINQYPIGSNGYGGMSISSAGLSVDSVAQNSIKMCPNDNVCLQFDFTDPDLNDVSISSNVLTALPGATFSITNNNTPNPTAILCWNPTTLDHGFNVFSISVKDSSCPIYGIQTFTYDITVLDQVSAGADQIICDTQAAQLNASGGATYTWFDANTNIPVPVGPQFSCNPCSNPIAMPLVSTDYYVLSSLITPCENTDTVTVTVAPDFTANVTGDTSLCGNHPTQLDVTILTGPIGTYTYSWNNAGTLNNANIQNPLASTSASTWYTPTITSPQGCSKIVDSAFVEIIPIPTITQNLTICQGDSILIAGVYQNTANIYLDTLQSIGGCDSMLYTTLILNTTFNSNQNQYICQGDSLLIYGTYQNTAGVYYDSLQTINGCDSILSTTLSILNFTSQFTFIDNGLGNYSFNNTSTGNYTLSDWNFGDGTTSSSMNPNHTFAVNGTFVVVLAITDSSALTGNSCIEYYMDTITVTTAANTLPCNAGFVVYPDAANTNITIFNSSIGNNLTYLWDFGDGNTSTLQNPTHTYTGSGPYYLCVTINDGVNCVDTFCDSVSVTGVAFKGTGGFTINIITPPVTTGINSTVLTSDFSIYPNPSNGRFIIKKPNNLDKAVQVRLLDATSRVIIETTIPIGEQKIDLDINEYSNGIYHLQLMSEDQIIIKKILKN